MINLKNVNSIIFDFGMVILNVDYRRIIHAFEDLNIPNFENIYSKVYQVHVIDDFEKGSVTTSEFRNEVRNSLEADLSDEQIDKAWNSMLLDLPPERLDVLSKLKKQYPLYLLSNTNEIHFNAWHQIIKIENGLDSMEPFFNKLYYSHLIKMRKPDIEIFELVIHENKLDPATTLFIDDSIQHIEGARKAGLQTYHFEEDDNITELFRDS